MFQPLTQLERRILDYLVDYLRRNTYQPSIREIGRRFGIKSTKTVSEYLQSLADKGWIERDPSRSRGVRLLGLDLHADCVTVPCYELSSSASAPQDRGSAVERFELDRKLAGPGSAFFLRMTGGSLGAEGIFEGDFLLVEPVPLAELEDGDLFAVRQGDGLQVARHSNPAAHDAMAPNSTRPTRPESAVSPGGPRRAAMLGRVIGIFRRLRLPSGLEAVPVMAAPAREAKR
ncbi:MAG: hypothetical protein HY703_13040 [Gemmatimonadetes bacterium]|nr:hypothetical protein [Gemmatimonadota bacterium]